MKLSILYLNLALLGIVYSICVLDTKKGWRLDCGLRDSYLLRIKDFGGFKANFDFGFGVGDEKGFPNSISKSNKPKEFNPYKHNKSKKNNYKKPNNVHKPMPQTYQSFHHQSSNYHVPDSSRSFSRRYDFPYEFHMPKKSLPTKKKKKKIMWPFSLFQWGQDEEEEQNTRTNSIQGQNIRRQFVQTPFISQQQQLLHQYSARQQQQQLIAHQQQQQLLAQHQFMRQRQQQQAAQSQFSTGYPLSPLQRQTFFHPSSNSLNQQQFLHPSYVSTQGFQRNQRPFVFRSPNVITSTQKIITIGQEMADLLKIPSNTEADSDNVPSFAAQMFVVREAPKEFYPPKYNIKSSPRKHTSVQIPRTKFYCEEQSFLPGIYADTQLGCKMFHLCVPSAIGSTLTSYLCPNSTLFDQSILQCNYWYNVDCESSANDFDANLALARSYRKINAAHLNLHGATDTKSLSLLSQNINNLSGSHAKNRKGRLLDLDSHEKLFSSRIKSILELIQSKELKQNEDSNL